MFFVILFFNFDFLLWTDFFLHFFSLLRLLSKSRTHFLLENEMKSRTRILNWKFAWYYAVWKLFYMSKIRLVFFSPKNPQFWFSFLLNHSWHVDWVAGISVQCSTRTAQKIAQLKFLPITVQQNTSIFFSNKRYVTLNAVLHHNRRILLYLRMSGDACVQTGSHYLKLSDTL
jgi:hypothetical protein